MRRLVCVYAAPGCRAEVWDQAPPASMVIGNGGRVEFGDFSVVFDGTDAGKWYASDRPPWLVCWKTAIGTHGPADAFVEHARFTKYSDALREAKAQERARLDLLGAKRWNVRVSE